MTRSRGKRHGSYRPSIPGGLTEEFNYFYDTDDLLRNARQRRAARVGGGGSRSRLSDHSRQPRRSSRGRRAQSNVQDDRSVERAKHKSYRNKARKSRSREKKKKNDPNQNEGIVALSDWIMPMNDKDDVKKKYSFKSKIGDGNFATVYRGEARSNGRKVAIKEINMNKVKGKEHYVENEVEVMARCRHKNIIDLVAAYKTSTHYYVVLSLLQYGDLFEAIRKHKQFEEVRAAGVVYDTSQAISYLHGFHIVHRDLKPENLLLTQDFRVKLADFGLACRVMGPLYRVCGTPTYVAPEVLAETGYGVPVDVWSLGIILYIMLCGYAPFRSSERKELFSMIQNSSFKFDGDRWRKVSSAAKDLISDMLEKKPKSRIIASDVARSEWVEHYKK